MSLGSDREPQPEYFSNKFFIQRNKDKGIWVTKDDRAIPIKDLSEEHKRNIEKRFGIKL